MSEYKITYKLNGRKARAIVHARNKHEAREDFTRATTHPANPQYKGPEILLIEEQK